jgi:hypothetical protein
MVVLEAETLNVNVLIEKLVLQNIAACLKSSPRVFSSLPDVPATSPVLPPDPGPSTLARFRGLVIVVDVFLGRVAVVELPPFCIHGSFRGILKAGVWNWGRTEAEVNSVEGRRRSQVNASR